jgi:hypothetical protein
MRIKLELRSTTALMMHSERLANPQDPITKQIAAFTSKKKNKTDADVAEISRLEWYGGLYTDADGNIVIPSANIAKSLRDAGTVTKSGKKIEQGLTPYALNVPLILPGNVRHQDKLWGKPEYIDKRLVKVGQARIVRARPIFSNWGVVAEFELLEDVLNLDDFIAIAELAGRATGLGDARRIGYGRYTAKVAMAAVQAAAA